MLKRQREARTARLCLGAWTRRSKLAAIPQRDGGWFVPEFAATPADTPDVDGKYQADLRKRRDNGVHVIELGRDAGTKGGQGGGRCGRDQRGNNCPLDHFKTVFVSYEIPDYVQHSSVLFNIRMY